MFEIFLYQNKDGSWCARIEGSDGIKYTKPSYCEFGALLEAERLITNHEFDDDHSDLPDPIV